MKLDKGTIRPGTVLEILDDGLIKASAPGLFSITDDPEMIHEGLRFECESEPLDESEE